MTKCEKNVSNTTPAVADAVAVAFPPTPSIENGQIRLGAQSPLFAAPAVADAGKMGRGAQSPVFLPREIADAGLVRMGAQTPAF